MQKIVINTQYGGFSLSPLGLKRWAELNNKECYFFKMKLSSDKYEPLTLEGAMIESYSWLAFTVPNPDDVLLDQSNWHEMSMEQRKESNEVYEKYSLSSRDIKRDDPTLVQVVEELKEKADGEYATLKVVSIPDDIEWEIEEYDGREWVAECHRTWN